MNNKLFLSKLEEKTELSPALVEQCKEALVDIIVESVSSGDNIQLQGLGTFELREKAERRMYNPRTNQYVTAKARRSIGFKASNLMKDKINSHE